MDSRTPQRGRRGPEKPVWRGRPANTLPGDLIIGQCRCLGSLLATPLYSSPDPSPSSLTGFCSPIFPMSHEQLQPLVFVRAGAFPPRPGLQLHFFFLHRSWSDESVPGSTTSSPILISSSSRSSSSEESDFFVAAESSEFVVPACTLASSICVSIS